MYIPILYDVGILKRTNIYDNNDDDELKDAIDKKKRKIMMNTLKAEPIPTVASHTKYRLRIHTYTSIYIYEIRTQDENKVLLSPYAYRHQEHAGPHKTRQKSRNNYFSRIMPRKYALWIYYYSLRIYLQPRHTSHVYKIEAVLHGTYYYILLRVI